MRKLRAERRDAQHTDVHPHTSRRPPTETNNRQSDNTSLSFSIFLACFSALRRLDNHFQNCIIISILKSFCSSVSQSLFSFRPHRTCAEKFAIAFHSIRIIIITFSARMRTRAHRDHNIFGYCCCASTNFDRSLV